MKAVAKNLIARYPEQDLQRAEVLEACSRQYCARSASDGNAEAVEGEGRGLRSRNTYESV